MATNVYIHHILSHSDPHFMGVFSSDTIPDHLSKNERFNIIVNLSKREELGTHFICIIRFPKKVFYIDPFGGACFIPKICTFLHNLNIKIYYQVKPVQHITSNFCGFFTIYFCLLYSYGLQRTTKYLLLSHNLNKNDELVISHICHIINNIFHYSSTLFFWKCFSKKMSRARSKYRS
jgi:hypothetical protein